MCVSLDVNVVFLDMHFVGNLHYNRGALPPARLSQAGAASARPAPLLAAADPGAGPRQPGPPSQLQRCHRLYPQSAGGLPHPTHSPARGLQGRSHDHGSGQAGAGLSDGLAGGAGLPGHGLVPGGERLNEGRGATAEGGHRAAARAEWPGPARPSPAAGCRP